MPNPFESGAAGRRPESHKEEIKSDILNLFQRLDTAYSPSEVDQAAHHLNDADSVPEVSEIVQNIQATIEDLKMDNDDQDVDAAFEEALRQRAA